METEHIAVNIPQLYKAEKTGGGGGNASLSLYFSIQRYV